MGFKRPESALVVIYDEEGKVLVMQRNDDPDFWQSVTGTMESDEVPIQTAAREVKEETSINIAALNLQLQDCRRVNQYEIRAMWLHKYPAGTKYNTEHVFTLQVPKGTDVALTEHSAYQWLKKADAVAKVWSPTNKEAIADFVPEKDLSSVQVN